MTICIIGDGLTALTLAKTLVNQNIYVDVIPSNKNLEFSKNRTIGITKSNFDYFNKNIINIKKIGWKLKRIEIYSNNLKKEKLIKFENANEQLFSIVKNYKLYDILKKSLSKNKYLRFKLFKKLNHLFTGKYELIINCDYNNLITQKYFSKKTIKKYDSSAYTTIINHKKILNDTAIQIFTKKGPIAFLPISNDKTSIVYSVHNSFKKQNENIEELIRNENFKYKINGIEKISCFELKSLNLRSYYHNNILAFGDLLHKVHPLAGQGFNMTIRDIKVFLKIIQKKNDLGLPIDTSVNIEFENFLKHKNLIFSTGVDLVHDFFNIERKSKSTLLSKSVKMISKLPTINRLFIKAADKGILF